MSKYNAHKVQADGYTFDSGAEYNRYCELKMIQQAGYISLLEVHPKFTLQPTFKHNGVTIRKIEYVGDFQYMEDGKVIVEDVKGFSTPAFKMKYKMFLRLYPEIEFRMVKA